MRLDGYLGADAQKGTVMTRTYLDRKYLHYIRHYPEWVDKINTMTTVRAITYDSDKVQTSPGDEMLEIAIQIEAYPDKINKVDKCIEAVYGRDEVAHAMRNWYCYGIWDNFRHLKRWKFYQMERLLISELMWTFSKWIEEGENDDNTHKRDT